MIPAKWAVAEVANSFDTWKPHHVGQTGSKLHLHGRETASARHHRNEDLSPQTRRQREIVRHRIIGNVERQKKLESNKQPHTAPGSADGSAAIVSHGLSFPYRMCDRS
jgi:hypothetical protein